MASSGGPLETKKLEQAFQLIQSSSRGCPEVTALCSDLASHLNVGVTAEPPRESSPARLRRPADPELDLHLLRKDELDALIEQVREAIAYNSRSDSYKNI